MNDEFPKRNARLTTGDYCYIPRNDGRFALFLYLFPVSKSRSYFYGALATFILDRRTEDDIPTRVDFGDHAMIHIQCYRENRTPVAGNIVGRTAPSALEHVKRSIENLDPGAKHRVWGYRTVLRRSNEIDIE